MKSKIGKLIIATLCLAACLFAFAGCSGGKEKDILVISRDGASGTREAFDKAIGLNKKVDGVYVPVDGYVPDMELAGTAEVMTTVASNVNAIGYISLGSVNDTIKALKLDGIEPTAENVNNGSYGIARPFVLFTKTGAELSLLAQEFIKYSKSSQAQEIISKKGFIPLTENQNAEKYVKNDNLVVSSSDRLACGGSTSVQSCFKALIDGFKGIYGDNVINAITYTGSGSSEGISGTKDGVYTIGAASKAVDDVELDEYTLCNDGVAVIVNKSCSLVNVTKEQVRKIFMKEITKFSMIA